MTLSSYQLKGFGTLWTHWGLGVINVCMTNTTVVGPNGAASPKTAELPIKVKYVLYARKSTDSEERQVLSIDSQVKEMLQLAEKEGLEVAGIRRESHSAKETGQRDVFNEIVKDIRLGKFNGILTWAPDRIARNAGDLGAIVDLMDQKLLLEIRTYGQKFSNNPNEKFLLMILGSQAKLENDNRGVNVKRGLRTRVEMGLWPGMAPLGYLNQKMMDRKCQLIVDPERAHVVKQMFEKVAYEKWSGRKVFNWLKHDLNFYTRGNKPLTLSGVYRVLTMPFYYGVFEYPRESGNWYQGKHKPLIDEDLFQKAQAQLKRDQIVRESHEFSFTKLFTCGLCQSGISAEEKFKLLKDGTTNRYIYYGCSRARDRNCKNKYIREEELIEELIKIIDKVNINELGMRMKLEEEIRRFNKLQKIVNGKDGNELIEESEVNIRQYAKYLLKEGSVSDKRELLANLRSRLTYTNKKVALVG